MRIIRIVHLVPGNISGDLVEKEAGKLVYVYDMLGHILHTFLVRGQCSSYKTFFQILVRKVYMSIPLVVQGRTASHYNTEGTYSVKEPPPASCLDVEG